MRALETGVTVEQDFLRVLYELAGGEARRPVFYGELSLRLAAAPEETERVCDFWADRGLVDWVTLGHVALTHLGARRAQRLAARGWSYAGF